MSKKKYPAKCVNKRCGRVVGRAEKSNKCSKCRRDWHRENHPLAYYWGKLKRRARERGIDFDLTLEEYTHFAIRTDYMKLKGKTSVSLSIDRIEPAFGYCAFNVRAISLSENSRKSWVPYFNGGKMPESMRRESDLLEVEYVLKMKRLANRIAKQFQLGSDQFWKAFHAEKAAILCLE